MAEHYWVPTILMSLMGGVIAVAYALDGTQFGTVLAMEPLAKFIDRVIFPPLEGASLSPSVKPEPA
jgi:hypothetical protein